jgi:hypothetical protein
MADAFTLHLPLEAPYRALAPEVASRYAELSGGSATEAATLAASLSAAIDRLAAGAGPNAQVDLSFRPNASGVHVDLSCNGRQESIHVTIPVAVKKADG